LLALSLCAPAFAGPVEFGVAEFNAALASRELKWKIKYEVTLDPPESYRIEPYKYGGAHITGGDLRGLMYGLLDAADQIRATGHLKQTQSAPAIRWRGARMLVHASQIDGFDWELYFNTLARDRFNRFTLVFLDSPYGCAPKLASISQLAAEFGIEFTLGIWEHQPSTSAQQVRDSLRQLLEHCPLIRTLQIRSDSKDFAFYREAFVNTLHEMGRRVAIDPRGALAAAEFVKSIGDSGAALWMQPVAWPPGFEVDLPVNFKSHALLYWSWGSLAYNPEARPEHGGIPAELAPAARIVALLAEAQVANPEQFSSPESNAAASFVSMPVSDINDFIATVPESVHNRLRHVASAKRTPLEIADALLAAAASLDSSTLPDLQLIAKQARYQAHYLRARYALDLYEATADPDSLNRGEKDFKSALAYADLASAQLGLDRIAAHRNTNDASALEEIPPLPKPATHVGSVHSAVKTAPPGQPINLTIEITGAKDIRAVRLHYRPVGAAISTVIEKPAAASIAFTIPPAASDLLYFFEIVTRDGAYFNPDPFSKTPYYSIKIESK
jgi:hypothetical protein